MKNVIIEGCDGSGKTTLIQALMQTGRFVAHARASDSKTGPVPVLDRWVEIDLDQIEEYAEFEGMPVYLYDRHPLVSELIYNDLRWTNPGLKGNFTDPDWVTQMRRRLGEYAVLVICSPPYALVEQVMQTQGRDAHMPGVFENRYTLWTRYQRLVWPGTIIRYDWTRDTPEDLIRTLELEGKN